MSWWLIGLGAAGLAYLALRGRGSDVFTVIVDTRQSASGAPRSTLAEVSAAVANAVRSQLPGAVFLGFSAAPESSLVLHYLYRGGTPSVAGASFAETVTRWLGAVVLSNLHVADARAVLGNVTRHRELGALRGLPRMATTRRRA